MRHMAGFGPTQRLPGGAGLAVGFSLARMVGVMILLIGMTSYAYGTPPIFENNTPVGFSPEDSTSQEDFVLGQRVDVRVDLNQAATPTYPVSGHFHNIERSKQVNSTDVDGLRADIAVSTDGTIHMAWISEETVTPVSTPIYQVLYARSENSGVSFSDPQSVSGSLRFDILTLSLGGTNAFSTLDLEVDSRGNPRVVYAFDFSPDGRTAQFNNTNPDNVFFNYSETGGASWLPGNNAVVVNDTLTVGDPRNTAFPRMAIDQRDNIFITYVRGVTSAGTTDDIMLAKIDRSTTPFSVEAVGSQANAGSTGGVRISPDGADRETGPDIAIGTGDVLHIIYYNDTADDIEHKTLLADEYKTVGTPGWDQNNPGRDVDDFDNSVANTTLETEADFYFPTILVDKQSSPDKVYALYKFGDGAVPIETIFFNNYTYDNAVGANAGWVVGNAAPVWSTANTTLFGDGVNNYNVELEWTVTERVSAAIDDRLSTRGDVHIAFTAGYSSGGEHDIYYGFYNGQTWSLPEKVADDDAGTTDGIAATDVFLSAPVLVKDPNTSSFFMAFSGGTGEGLGVDGLTNVNQHPYFKVLGRDVTFEDKSVPVGGFQYDLTYTPIISQTLTTEIQKNVVYVHAADNADGQGLGATGKSNDGFLAGEWESVATTLGDDDKNFEGRFNEDATSTNEWGDNGDKIGLLAKLNVLGSDSATAGAVPGNVQLISASTAATVGIGTDARTVKVEVPSSGGFAPVLGGVFFMLGARIDIVDSNTAPFVQVFQPDGVGDEANTSYSILYTMTDTDDDISTGNLKASLYFAGDSTLASVQDIRIFATLIADENDNSTIFSSGTDDFKEGQNQTYTWDDPPSALKDSLFASIFQVPSGDYYVYLVADDQKNPPVFARSPGAVAIRHKPIIDLVDPAIADTVDSGVRTGIKANPYDLDFSVRAFDLQGSTEVQLFFAEVSGLTSLSATGSFPNQKFVLGKSIGGNRGTAIPQSDTLTSVDTEFTWDITDSVFANSDSVIVAEGTYFIYLVASDSINVALGQSTALLTVKHSPSFTFYEPPRDSHREINTGSQPNFAIQWQKGRGDADFDDNATIDLYFTTDNPATINYEDFPDSLLNDVDTKTIAKGLTENGDAASDMYVWDLRNPPNDVPKESVSGGKVWLYAIITDSRGNKNVALGGALTMVHDPHITILSSKLDDYVPGFVKDDVLRIEWDDYLVDDGSSTDDAYIRLYAIPNPSVHTTLGNLEGAVDGLTDFLINSSNGNLTGGTVTSIREDSSDFFDWNTRLFGLATVAYDVYVAIGKDSTFALSTETTISKSSTALTLGVEPGAQTSYFSTNPTNATVATGDTVTMDVMVSHPDAVNLVQVVIDLKDNAWTVVDQGTGPGISKPFLDLNNVFPGTSAIEDTFISASSQMRFAKASFGGQTIGTQDVPVAFARFQLVNTGLALASPSLEFVSGETGTVFGQVGKNDPVDDIGDGLSHDDPSFTQVSRGSISTSVILEGRDLGGGDDTTLLDIHLRKPGSTIDEDDSIFRTANDDLLATTDTVEVETDAAGALALSAVPSGRWILTVKDTSHISGRSDTITIRNGEAVVIDDTPADADDVLGFFGSDLRGDPTTILPQNGAQMTAGDASEDNEINEDDVNLIIAAWGTNTAIEFFKQSDMNNDNVVGAVDLTVTTSNFGNSEGFGAPPVFKPIVRGDNSETKLHIHPLFDVAKSTWPGQEVEVEVRVDNLDDLAGFEFDLRFDPDSIEPMGDRNFEGDLFEPNPNGSVFQTRVDGDRLRVIGARIGKEWFATGEGALATLRFEVLREGGIESLQNGSGLLLNPVYDLQPVSWGKNIAELLVPVRARLDQNYPNPFNPSTAIPFAVPDHADVHLAIYNILGQKIRTLAAGQLAPGFHTLVWNGRDELGRQAASGMYLYLLEVGRYQQTRKMLLVR